MSLVLVKKNNQISPATTNFSGWLWGEGKLDTKPLLNDIWLVVSAEPKEITYRTEQHVTCNGRVVFSGNFRAAAQYLVYRGPERVVIGAEINAGDNKIIRTGDHGRSVVGKGVAITGDYGEAKSSDYGISIAGNNGTAITGKNGRAEVGFGGKASAGLNGEIRFKTADPGVYLGQTIHKSGYLPDVFYQVYKLEIIPTVSSITKLGIHYFMDNDPQFLEKLSDSQPHIQLLQKQINKLDLSTRDCVLEFLANSNIPIIDTWVES